MADADPIDLSLDDLRAVTRYAAACARLALPIFERDRPADPRPRTAIEAAEAFASGERRSKRLRDRAWDAQRAAHDARDAGHLAASESARAALAACGAAFLHPIAKATQVKHVLGSAAYAMRAFELDGGGAPPSAVAPGSIVIDVLRRYPPASAGGGRVGAIVRELDDALRRTRGSS